MRNFLPLLLLFSPTLADPIGRSQLDQYDPKPADENAVMGMFDDDEEEDREAVAAQAPVYRDQAAKRPVSGELAQYGEQERRDPILDRLRRPNLQPSSGRQQPSQTQERLKDVAPGAGEQYADVETSLPRTPKKQPPPLPAETPQSWETHRKQPSAQPADPAQSWAPAQRQQDPSIPRDSQPIPQQPHKSPELTGPASQSVRRPQQPLHQSEQTERLSGALDKTREPQQPQRPLQRQPPPQPQAGLPPSPSDAQKASRPSSQQLLRPEQEETHAREPVQRTQEPQPPQQLQKQSKSGDGSNPSLPEAWQMPPEYPNSGEAAAVPKTAVVPKTKDKTTTLPPVKPAKADSTVAGGVGAGAAVDETVAVAAEALKDKFVQYPKTHPNGSLVNPNLTTKPVTMAPAKAVPSGDETESKADVGTKDKEEAPLSPETRPKESTPSSVSTTPDSANLYDPNKGPDKVEEKDGYEESEEDEKPPTPDLIDQKPSEEDWKEAERRTEEPSGQDKEKRPDAFGGLPSLASNKDELRQSENSHFMTYAVSAAILVAAAYIVYHNKQKVLALVVEGRAGRGGGTAGSRRGSSAHYRRLETEDQDAALLRGGERTTSVVY